MPEKSELTKTIIGIRQCTTRLAHEGAYWEEDEKEKLKHLFYSGVGISEIAVELQRTEPAVFQQIEKMDLYQRKEYPQRQWHAPRHYRHFCRTCRLDPEICPGCEHYVAAEEDA